MLHLDFLPLCFTLVDTGYKVALKILYSKQASAMQIPNVIPWLRPKAGHSSWNHAITMHSSLPCQSVRPAHCIWATSSATLNPLNRASWLVLGLLLWSSCSIWPFIFHSPTCLPDPFCTTTWLWSVYSSHPCDFPGVCSCTAADVPRPWTLEPQCDFSSLPNICFW